ncbi:unannotated protein [freshwater metagenome]|uniref:Unannotated protein n=1 Tax=freshwater metagenome TaxID=449393 RepID=A0A6J6N8V5_9ZZZZ
MAGEISHDPVVESAGITFNNATYDIQRPAGRYGGDCAPSGFTGPLDQQLGLLVNEVSNQISRIGVAMDPADESGDIYIANISVN